MIISPGISSTMENVIDMELRVVLRTPATQTLEKTYVGPFREMADRWNSEHTAKLEHASGAATPVMVGISESSGRSMHWTLQGEAKDGGGPIIIFIHPNTIRDNARDNVLPFIRKAFTGMEDISDEEFIRGSVRSIIGHEVGHAFAPIALESVRRRGGNNAVLEELKADTVGMHEFLTAKENGIMTEQELICQFYILIGDICNYVRMGEENPYHLDGIKMLTALLDNNILVKAGNTYQVNDPIRGVKILADIGTNTLDSIYLNDESSDEKTIAYIESIRDLKKRKDVNDFIETVAAIGAK